MQEFRRMAAAMDLRIQQLTAEGVHGLAVIERMIGHLPDLHRIWVGTSDHQLATLCNDFPGFSRYASLIGPKGKKPLEVIGSAYLSRKCSRRSATDGGGPDGCN